MPLTLLDIVLGMFCVSMTVIRTDMGNSVDKVRSEQFSIQVFVQDKSDY